MDFNPDAAKIKRWREERYWSQEHLADLAGIGLRTVQRIENGEQASRDSVMALAAAFGVDAIALTIDPQIEKQRKTLEKKLKDAAAFRLSFFIHIAGYVLGMVVFTGISMGVGGSGFAMKWPMIWWTVGFIGHGAAVAIVYLVLRYEQANVG